MKLEKNVQYFAEETCTGIPARVALAAKFLAGILSDPSVEDLPAIDFCKECLALADRLIEAHNQTCEGE